MLDMPKQTHPSASIKSVTKMQHSLQRISTGRPLTQADPIPRSTYFRLYAQMQDNSLQRSALCSTYSLMVRASPIFYAQYTVPKLVKDTLLASVR